MKSRLVDAVPAFVFTLMTSTASAALVDTLYVTDGDNARLAIVNGSTATIADSHKTGSPLAVRNTIWIGDYNSLNNQAIEYDLNGTATGNTADYPAPILAVDGASNGNINYALGGAFTKNATVYSANPDWTNITKLFSVTGIDLVGITYDSVLDSIWISDGGSIYQYSTSGDLISQFVHKSGRGSLAYETSTDTLWYVKNDSDLIVQFSKDGTVLGTVTVSGLTANNWGAEFSSVPVPPALYLFGSGLLGLIGISRRRKA